MASIDSRILAFMSENGLDEGIKDSLTELVQECFVDYAKHMSAEWVSAPVFAKSPSGPKAKKDKLVDPTEAEQFDDLRKCTVEILNDFCKEKLLKIGGTKRDIMERVWRAINDESTVDDIGRAGKAKKEKAPKEVHQCEGCNALGKRCKNPAVEQFDDEWLCFRHVPTEEPEPVVSEPKKVGSKPSLDKFKKK